MYKELVHTSQRTEIASIRKINQLMLCREIMAVYYASHMGQKNTQWADLLVHSVTTTL
jgi:hypothetical protein